VQKEGVLPHDLLEKVLEAHGGLTRWAAVDQLRFEARCGGLALAARWQRNAFRYYRARVSTRTPQVSFAPFKGQRGVFTADRVWIESSGGAVRKERRSPRRLFPGGRRALVWDALDILYFGGYAIWNYLCTPFLLTHPGVRLTRGPDWQEGGETWQRLVVRFPETLPTHCREQVFYVDHRGMIRRHDYTAEVIGHYARAARFCQRHRRFDGLVFPTRHRMFPRRRDNRAWTFPTLVWIDIDRIECRRN
jgi:hypothetical protein